MKWREINKYTDKFRDHSYLSFYKFIGKNNPKSILEIGVDLGAPFYYWKKIFPGSIIWGVDNRSLEECSNQRSLPHLSIPEDCTYINKNIFDIDYSNFPSFDFILDDGSHWEEHQLFILNTLYSKLNKNGILVIEDVRSQEIAIRIVNKFKGNKDKLFIADRTFIKGHPETRLIVYYNEEE